MTHFSCECQHECGKKAESNNELTLLYVNNRELKQKDGHIKVSRLILEGCVLLPILRNNGAMPVASITDVAYMYSCKDIKEAAEKKLFVDQAFSNAEKYPKNK